MSVHATLIPDNFFLRETVALECESIVWRASACHVSLPYPCRFFPNYSKTPKKKRRQTSARFNIFPICIYYHLHIKTCNNFLKSPGDSVSHHHQRYRFQHRRASYVVYSTIQTTTAGNDQHNTTFQQEYFNGEIAHH